MVKRIVSNELMNYGQILEPLLPKHTLSPKEGCPQISDRAALTKIIFVFKMGIPWEDLPQKMGCGSGMTYWRRLLDWSKYGVWKKIYHIILQNMHYAKKLYWSSVPIDSSVIQAKRGQTYRT